MPALPGKGLTLTSPLPLARAFIGIVFLLSTASASVAQMPPRDGGAGRGGPPPEAFAACASSSQDNVCTVVSPRGAIEGTCQPDRRSDALVCVPQNGRPQNGREGQRPPQAGANMVPGRGSMREHTVTQSSGVSKLYPATELPITDSEYVSTLEGEWRVIKANSIPLHNTGEFPNPGNPNIISEQNVSIRIPAMPVKTQAAKRVKVPGYGLNGVSFDPGAGEFYKGDPSLGWQYEALSGAVALGIDKNYAHVQPTGRYHYHGFPKGLMERLIVDPGHHSPQIGWAVDGFPIYALYGIDQINDGGRVRAMQSSYRLKPGTRPAVSNQPGGTYDGTFTADYEYVSGLGDLDECNGRETVTSDFPNGTYAYFLTQTYPVVPRCVMGTPDPASQRKHR